MLHTQPVATQLSPSVDMIEACRWRLLIDGSLFNTREVWSHNSVYGPAPALNSTDPLIAGGWRIDPYTLMWMPDSVPAGSHTYVIQVLWQGGSSEVRSWMALVF